MTCTYVLVRCGGRGAYNVYHRFGPDGSSPLCAAALQPEHWTIVPLQRAEAQRRICCTNCTAAAAGRPSARRAGRQEQHHV